jgi:glycosyltransferase involved in cell wall biosynthesis
MVTMADMPEGGGRTSRLKTLAGCLARRGHAVRIWSEMVLGQFPARLMQIKGEVEGIPYEILSGSLERKGILRQLQVAWRATRRFWKIRREVDLLWLNELAFHDMFPLMVAAALSGVKVVLSYEDERSEQWTWKFWKGGLKNVTALNYILADRFLTKRADAVVVISTYLERKYRRFGARRLMRVPTIVDPAYWRCPEKEPARPARFLYSGSLFGGYAISEILTAMVRLRQEGFSFFFHCVGGGNYDSPSVKAMMQQVRQLGPEEWIVWKEVLPLEELRQEICRADILLCIRVQTKRAESGLATKLSEYLASGRPVVVSDVGDMCRYVEDGESALVVRHVTVEGIEEQLRRALQQLDRLQAIGRQGRLAAEQHFGYAAIGKKLDGLLAHLMGRAHASAPQKED